MNTNDCIGRIGKYCAADFYEVLKEEMDKNNAIDDVVLTIVREGYLLSGNHRHACKEWIRINEPKEYDNPERRPFWNGTYAQLYVGLSPCQARFMSYIDNERSKTQSEDTAASKIEVNGLVHMSITSNRSCPDIVSPITSNWKTNDKRYMQNLRRAFTSQSEAFWPIGKKKIQLNVLKHLQKSNPDATMDDAKDQYVEFQLMSSKNVETSTNNLGKTNDGKK